MSSKMVGPLHKGFPRLKKLRKYELIGVQMGNGWGNEGTGCNWVDGVDRCHGGDGIRVRALHDDGQRHGGVSGGGGFW